MKIFVLDPGLKNATGHHMALLEYFEKHLDQNNTVHYFCAQEFDARNLTASNCFSNVSVYPTFKCKFYTNYNKLIKYTDANDYVLSLSQEYFETLFGLEISSNIINVLLPTLLWDHALAFDQALRRYKLSSPDIQINIVALLMFNPTGSETIEDKTMELNSTMAFKALSRHPEVQFYAGDQEAMEEYRRILGNDDSVNLHPCFLVSQTGKEIELPEKYVIGYLGDAKKEKGFIMLPEVIDRFLSSQCKHTLLIHYTLESQCQELLSVEENIQLKAASHCNIEVVKGYLPDTELQSYLANSVQIILNYDENVYSKKTSGIVWLAARHGILITCSRKTWMWREYSRLAGTKQISLSHDQHVAERSNSMNSDYYKQIFAPFVPWLTSKCKAYKPISEAT